MATSDRDIRMALYETELARFSADPHSLLVDELGVCQGEFRIDVAVVNGALHGWEIKSDRDTLARLPGQAQAYSRVFDTVTLVVGETHLDDALALIPGWWGVLVASGRRSGAALDAVRAGGRNPAPDPLALAQLLWRDELVAILADLDAPKKLLRQPKWDLWPALAARLEVDELAARVRAALKARPEWRRADRPAPGSPRT
jgi:hypothetical protein